MKRKDRSAFISIIAKKVVNKYMITFIIFLSWLIFFDKYNFFAQLKLKASTVKLEEEHRKLQEDILLAKKEKQELMLDQEKYGREKYYLHKHDEDVFIIE